MSNLRKTIISNTEKQFLIKNLTEWTRLDGRSFDEFRDIEIKFGKDWGCCYVSLGKTKVIAQVSCELQVPKSSRPSEGILNINLELNAMGEPNFETGKQSEISSQLNRLLEKCIKDSKAVDLESLCVKMNERVWSIRVDINLLNHEGNILDCASIAALAALAHFRRPDVTCEGTEYKIHSIKERDPIPTVIHHYPVCISYTIYSGGDFILADPTLLEEGVADAFLSIGLNGYKELCGLHLGGKVQLSPNSILETTNKASKRAGKVIELIKTAVEKDTKEKLSLKDTGFHKFALQEVDRPLSELSLCLDHWSTAKGRKKKTNIKKMETDQEEEDVTKSLNQQTTEFVPKEWDVVESDSSETEEDVVYIEPPKVETLNIADTDSEEDEVVILNSDKKQKSPKKKSKKKVKE